MTTIALPPDEFADIVSLASEATIRQRIYRTYAWDRTKANRLAYDMSTVRLRGYETKLGELARQVGVNGPVQLQDAVTLDSIVQDSRGVAFAVLQTHNADLRSFLAQQPRGLSQRELSARVRTWEQERASWKTTQVAKTELMEGRNRAAADVLDKNGLQVLQRATPQTAQCPLCQAIVARGWMTPAQIDFSLPRHPSCRHSLEQRSLKQATASRDKLWLGEWRARTG